MLNILTGVWISLHTCEDIFLVESTLFNHFMVF